MAHTLPAQRRHILYFQRNLRSAAPFALSTTVDATQVREVRDAGEGRQLSYVALLVHALGHVLASEGDLNVVSTRGLVPRVHPVKGVRPKIAVDARQDGVRVTYGVVLPPVETLSIYEIDALVRRLGTTPAGELPETKGARLLQRLPRAIGWPAFRRAVSAARSGPDAVGTVAVSSLSEPGVEGFWASGGTPITVNAGRIEERPWAVDGKVELRPLWPLTFVFDHRLIDGARAAEIMRAVRDRLDAGDFA